MCISKTIQAAAAGYGHEPTILRRSDDSAAGGDMTMGVPGATFYHRVCPDLTRLPGGEHAGGNIYYGDCLPFHGDRDGGDAVVTTAAYAHHRAFTWRICAGSIRATCDRMTKRDMLTMIRL